MVFLRKFDNYTLHTTKHSWCVIKHMLFAPYMSIKLWWHIRKLFLAFDFTRITILRRCYAFILSSLFSCKYINKRICIALLSAIYGFLEVHKARKIQTYSSDITYLLRCLCMTVFGFIWLLSMHRKVLRHQMKYCLEEA